MIKRTLLILSTLFLLAWLTAVILSGCGQQTSTTVTENYFPHEDGYSWTYTVISTIEMPEEDPYTTITEETYYFDGTTQITEEIIAQNYFRQGTTESSYYLINGSGVYRFGDSQHPTTEGKIILSYPLNIGKTWEGLFIDGTTKAHITAEVSAYELISTPLGSFYAYKISHALGENSEFHEWFALNIGKVKRCFRGSNLPILDDFAGEYRIIPGQTIESTSVLKSKNF